MAQWWNQEAQTKKSEVLLVVRLEHILFHYDTLLDENAKLLLQFLFVWQITSEQLILRT